MKIITTLKQDADLYSYQLASHCDKTVRLTMIGQNDRKQLIGLLVLLGTREEFATLAAQCSEAATSQDLPTTDNITEEPPNEPRDNVGF